jgi:hypothetical protein
MKYFGEVRAKFIRQFRWNISDKMISKALHYDGGGADDQALTLKVLERMARQRNDEERAECLAALTRRHPSRPQSRPTQSRPPQNRPANA